MNWRDLPQAMTAAYRPYLAKVAAEFDIAAAIAAGETWLSTELAALAATPFVLQRRAPLEVFQESMRFPTEALDALGVPKPSRNAVAAAALPGDAYGLAPASTQDLGTEVWEAHISWGAAKATAIRTVAWFGRDLADRSKIEAAAANASLAVAVAPEDLIVCFRVLVDLEFAGAAAIVASSVTTGLPTLAYGPHKATAVLDEARTAGATVVPRSAFFRDLTASVEGGPSEAEGHEAEGG